MAINIGINGFGRIGRYLLCLLQDNPNLNLSVINARADNSTLAHLLKYDSLLGTLPAEVHADAGRLWVDGQSIRVFAERDPAAGEAALAALTAGAAGNGNLLELSVNAARAKASVGEISLALEKVFGRHAADASAVTGVYLREAGATPQADRARAMTEAFRQADGRKPRVMIAKMGQDGHDRGQKVIASGFADLGFDVDIGNLFQTPAEAAAQAVAENVHVVGASSLAAGHLTLVPELRDELAMLGRPDILVVVGGVIPPEDFQALRDAGVAAIFTPGTVVPEAAIEVLDRLNEQMGYAQLEKA